MITKQQILEALKAEIARRQYFYPDDDRVTLPTGEEVDFVVKEEVNLGDGNELSYVLYLPDVDMYICLSGLYSSWDTSIIDEVFEVFPHQVHKTTYMDKPQTQEELAEEVSTISKFISVKLRIGNSSPE